jgi:hypothetical protein
MPKPSETYTPPETIISEPGHPLITTTPRPRGGLSIHRGQNHIALTSSEANRLKHAINAESIARQNGTGYFEDRRVRTPDSGKFANRGGNQLKYTSETTPQ